MRNCSKCGLKPARDEKQRYCDDCHAAYQVNYRKLAAKKRERAAYFRGFEACRGASITALEARGLWADWTGFQAAQVVRDLRSV